MAGDYGGKARVPALTASAPKGAANLQAEARRNSLGHIPTLDGSEPRYYLSNAPDPLETLACVGGSRWHKTEFETDVGLDEYETRTWPGWHRHMAMCLLGGAFLLSLQQDWGKKDAPATRPQVYRVVRECCPGRVSGRMRCCGGWSGHSYAASGRDSRTRGAATDLNGRPQAPLLKSDVVILENWPESGMALAGRYTWGHQAFIVLGERSSEGPVGGGHLDHFYGLLASLRGQLFRDSDFFYCADNGRDSVPPSLLATALVQTHDKVSIDIRWKVALGIEIEDRPFAKSTKCSGPS